MSGTPLTLQVHRPMRFLVTGSARGLGRGLSRMLVEAGHDVFLLDNNAEELEHTLTVHLPRVAPKQKGRYAGTYCDISDASSVKSALRKARQHHRDGKIDVLINNAGRARPFWQSVESIASDLDACDPLLDDKQPAEDDPVIREWRSFIDTNLSGAFIVTRMAVGMLHRTGKTAAEQDLQPSPSIIHISSSRAKQSEPNQEPYASTKAGLRGLNHALASSLSGVGIRSNTILPGWFPSMYESKEGDEKGDEWHTDLTPLDQSQHWSGRVGRIEDLYNAVMFLATTRFMTGEEIVLDGGMTKKMQYEV